MSLTKKREAEGVSAEEEARREQVGEWRVGETKRPWERNFARRDVP